MYVLTEDTVVGVYVHVGAFLTVCSLALCNFQMHGPRFLNFAKPLQKGPKPCCEDNW